jgi:hypothetical protein
MLETACPQAVAHNERRTRNSIVEPLTNELTFLLRRAEGIEGCLLQFDRNRYDIDAFVLMSNQFTRSSNRCRLSPLNGGNLNFTLLFVMERRISRMTL